MSIDVVGDQLKDAIARLEAENLKYSVSYTRPNRATAILEANLLYVIRQRIDADGLYNLTVAAKLNIN
ncbi:MAG: hypothetical protein LBR56_07465 [Sporomusaceae bacterium]|nr:hypothetical protein [Sporomusaceae bacterium]